MAPGRVPRHRWSRGAPDPTAPRRAERLQASAPAQPRHAHPRPRVDARRAETCRRECYPADTARMLSAQGPVFFTFLLINPPDRISGCLVAPLKHMRVLAHRFRARQSFGYHPSCSCQLGFVDVDSSSFSHTLCLSGCREREQLSTWAVRNAETPRCLGLGALSTCPAFPGGARYSLRSLLLADSAKPLTISCLP